MGELIDDGDERDMDVPELQVTKVSDGLGFGYGPISRQALKGEVGYDAFAQAESAYFSKDILVPVGEIDGQTIEDDGCGDGRRVAVVYKGNEVKQHSLDRYKVFGGGVVMTAATRIGLGMARGRTLEQTMFDSMDQMDEAEVDYGAHTADHVKNPDTNSGCGAIDNAPAEVAYIVMHPDKIREGVEALGADTAGLDDILDNFSAYAAEVKGQPYSGRKVVDEVTRRGKVVKELLGAHKEGDLVINKIKGYTVNQEAVRQATGGKLDAFATDEPRLIDIADKQYAEAETKQRALLSELVFTLAVSAVLTPGDQRIYVVQEADAVPADASR